MPLTPNDRKIVLLKAGVSQAEVAAACGADNTLVSHVLAGRKLSGPAARRVMEYIARLAGLPVADVFPIESESAA